MNGKIVEIAKQVTQNLLDDQAQMVMQIAELTESNAELKELREHDLYLPKGSQLKDFKEKHYFNTVEVMNFCLYDETSPLKGKDVDQEAITRWLRSGKLEGYRNYYYWYVSKKALVEYFEYRRKMKK